MNVNVTFAVPSLCQGRYQGQSTLTVVLGRASGQQAYLSNVRLHTTPGKQPLMLKSPSLCLLCWTGSVCDMTANLRAQQCFFNTHLINTMHFYPPWTYTPTVTQAKPYGRTITNHLSLAALCWYFENIHLCTSSILPSQC